MLVTFSVSNFRSFGEEVTLNMVASNRMDDHPGHCIPLPGDSAKKLLRTAVIYGANAAGKSNLVKAMNFGQRAIIGGEQQFPLVQPFRFDPSLSDQPSSFEFRFLLYEHIFIYGFDVAREGGIKSEWLSVVVGNDEVPIFTRNGDGIATVDHGIVEIFPQEKPAFETLQVLGRIGLTKRQLFLNRIGSIPVPAQGTVMSGIIRWLTKDLVILSTDSRSRDILDRLQSDDLFRQFSQRFLSSVGTGVSDLFVIEGERAASDWEQRYLLDITKIGNADAGMVRYDSSEDSDSRIDPKDPTKLITRRIVATHRSRQPNKTFPLPFSEESDGTKQLLHLMPVICPPREQIQHNKVVVIDELDRSLHPLICWEFIRFFGESCPGEHRQLIVTTHEAHLLDQGLLRRDEYWFVEKDASQQSQLVPLSDFKIRNDLQVQKGYLQGRFGAIPIIGGLQSLERLLECGAVGEGGDAAKKTPN